MKFTIEPTDRLVEIDTVNENLMTSEEMRARGPVEARVWEGTTENGVPVQLLVIRVACSKDAPEVCDRLAQALRETRAPTAAVQAFPSRLVL